VGTVSESEWLEQALNDEKQTEIVASTRGGANGAIYLDLILSFMGTRISIKPIDPHPKATPAFRQRHARKALINRSSNRRSTQTQICAPLACRCSTLSFAPFAIELIRVINHWQFHTLQYKPKPSGKLANPVHPNEFR